LVSSEIKSMGPSRAYCSDTCVRQYCIERLVLEKCERNVYERQVGTNFRLDRRMHKYCMDAPINGIH